jgi:hypothetical protein
MLLEIISPEKNKCCVSMVEDLAEADGSVELNFREVALPSLTTQPLRQ